MQKQQFSVVELQLLPEWIWQTLSFILVAEGTTVAFQECLSVQVVQILLFSAKEVSATFRSHSASSARSTECENWIKGFSVQKQKPTNQTKPNHHHHPKRQANEQKTSTNLGRKCVLNLVWNILAKMTSRSTNKTLVAVKATIFHVVRRVSCVFGQVCSVTKREQYHNCAYYCCYFILILQQ